MENQSSVLSLSKILEGKVMEAARSGNIQALYQLISEDKDVLKRIEMMHFSDNPLHIASEAGMSDFAMEMIYLMPSFATKLNKDGLSPLHLAFQNGHTKLGLDILKLNANLVRVKGKMGYTPMHFLAMKEGEKSLIEKFLTEYPQCIDDVTSRDESALHVAARQNNLKALEVLLRWLRRTSRRSLEQKDRILNLKNKDGETVLHVVSKNQPDPKIVKLLTNMRIDTNATDLKGSTALDILKGRIGEEHNKIKIKMCVNILCHAQTLKFYRKIPSYFFELLVQWQHEIRYMSPDKGNALLVVTVLILTATFQATLSPPGGVLPPDNAESSKNTGSKLLGASKNNNATTVVEEKIEFKRNNTVGSSVLSTETFLWFYIPNMVAFSISFLLTCFVVLTVVSGYFAFTLMFSLSTLLFCLLVSSVMIISPNDPSSHILFRCVYTLVYVTYLAILPVLIPKLRKAFH